LLVALVVCSCHQDTPYGEDGLVEIDSVRVTLLQDGKAGKEVEVQASGMQVGVSGELLVIRTLEESDDNLQPQIVGYAAVVYAPGTWFNYELVNPKPSPKIRKPKLTIPTIH
jgi:hypothetical protein